MKKKIGCFVWRRNEYFSFGIAATFSSFGPNTKWNNAWNETCMCLYGTRKLTPVFGICACMPHVCECILSGTKIDFKNIIRNRHVTNARKHTELNHIPSYIYLVSFIIFKKFSTITIQREEYRIFFLGNKI